MPKIILNLREDILERTKEILMEKGYEAINIRIIANELSVGVGTIYNYFPSKMDMVKQVILTEWEHYSDRICKDIRNAKTLEEGVLCGFRAIRAFSNQFQLVFEEEVVRKEGGLEFSVCSNCKQLLQDKLHKWGTCLEEKFHPQTTDLALEAIIELFLIYATKEIECEKVFIHNVIMKLV